MDGLFRPFDPKDSAAVDVMVVGTGDGYVHLSIYDSFIVGLFPPPFSISGADDIRAQMVLHTAHKRYSTHALLMDSSTKSMPGLYYVPMDLRFVSASSEYLSLLASRSTALDNLLRYINQVQNLMTSEWQASQDLPRKFLRNIDETLEEKHGCNIMQAMYHSVATGHTFPAMREWLVDELAERVSNEKYQMRQRYLYCLEGSQKMGQGRHQRLGEFAEISARAYATSPGAMCPNIEPPGGCGKVPRF